MRRSTLPHVQMHIIGIMPVPCTTPISTATGKPRRKKKKKKHSVTRYSGKYYANLSITISAPIPDSPLLRYSLITLGFEDTLAYSQAICILPLFKPGPY